MAGVYISYPFCAQKCTYCNFASGVFPRETEVRYLDRLYREIADHRWEWAPETVYLGGGTPGSLDPKRLSSLLDGVPGRPWAEATIEAAPGSIRPDAARSWVEMGIGRASLGVQSFVRGEVARTGRKHTAEVVEADVRTLRAAGFRDINIDLIAGLPGQTPESWRESLVWIDRLAPEHVSVYMLEVDEDSRLGRELLLGGVRYGAADAPSGDLTADLYECAVDTLARAGIFRYEISNFAHPGHESRHNLKYWRLEPYIGFGADAHSFDGRRRWQNPETVLDYLESERGDAVEANLAEERFFVGLRLSEGIRPDPEERARFREPIERFLRDGLLASDNGMLRLTARGVLLSNEVFQEFIT